MAGALRVAGYRIATWQRGGYAPAAARCTPPPGLTSGGSAPPAAPPAQQPATGEDGGGWHDQGLQALSEGGAPQRKGRTCGPAQSFHDAAADKDGSSWLFPRAYATAVAGREACLLKSTWSRADLSATPAPCGAS